MKLLFLTFFIIFTQSSNSANAQTFDSHVEGIIKTLTNNDGIDENLTSKTSCAACNEDEFMNSQIIPPKNCKIISKRDKYKLVPENWGLLATGADLLRGEEKVKKMKYTYKIGIVDTGLMLRGNPDAGKILLENSPEKDNESGHGCTIITKFKIEKCHSQRVDDRPQKIEEKNRHDRPKQLFVFG